MIYIFFLFLLKPCILFLSEIKMRTNEILLIKGQCPFTYNSNNNNKNNNSTHRNGYAFNPFSNYYEIYHYLYYFSLRNGIVSNEALPYSYWSFLPICRYYFRISYLLTCSFLVLQVWWEHSVRCYRLEVESSSFYQLQPYCFDEGKWVSLGIFIFFDHYIKAL